MPNYIPNRHINRMFPYAFFDELYDVMPEVTPENPVFLLRDTPVESKLDDDRVAQFNELRKQLVNNKSFEENNLYTLDQGEFLVLDTYIKRTDKEKMLARQHVAKYVLLVQYYDSSDQPVFSKDVSMKTIRKIPEILWDDPRLAIILMEVIPEDPDEFDKKSELGIIKAPDFFMEQFIEPIPENTLTQSNNDPEMR